MCACIRESLPVRNFNNSYLCECLTLEVTISNKKSYVITFYRSPSQTSDEFDSFISNLDLLINIASVHPYFVILLGDFFFIYNLHVFKQSLQSPGTYISARTWNPNQKAITK